MTQARVEKLHALLARIQRNRRPLNGGVALGGAAKATPVPLKPAPAPEPEPEREALAVEAAPPVRAAKPTPMEMALETIDATEPSMDVEISVDDGPEITIDADGETLEEAVPTAPVETRAPVEEPRAAEPPPLPSRAPVAKPRADEPVGRPPLPSRGPEPAPRPPAAAREPALIDEPTVPREAPLAARPIDLPAPAPSGPVARVVSRPTPSEPATFGDLLDRTLALRPRS